ncbi:protein-lysine N-methyltransferase EEF2KMT isoform X2 [Halyomorpha halys]|uniref:protein-lysine N-methyltransferase EEF2KMT isoform X2 n=1 Tax=Halyomorpha halys TaxID=286706 RepID=UPI0006D52276|nr:protein-lysine N-methyltransferase EEF2KMT-like isoform X2 [Halyomorpha halys]
MVGKCDAEACQLIQSFKKKFACSVDLKCFEWKDIFSHWLALQPGECEKHQAELLASTVENELILQYPVKKSYQLAFLKQLIQQTEELNIPYEEAYELYVKLLNSPQDDLVDCYKHYFFENKNIILKENKNFISSGTTGLCTWEAGKSLANWSFSQLELFKNKTVIELGCGSGLTGLVILNAKLLPKKYIFTDCHPLVLDQLKHNLNINISGKDWPRLADKTVVDVVEFNWEETLNTNLENFKEADLIIGADIVYDKSLILSLSSILEKLLDDSAKLAVIACTVRNQETVDTFISTIKSKGLEIEQDKSNYPMVIEANFSTPVNIYLIKKQRLIG